MQVAASNSPAVSSSAPFTRRYPPGVVREPDGRFRARVRLGRFDFIELGVHPTVAAASRACSRFFTLFIAGVPIETAIRRLQAFRVVPADTLPRGVYPVMRNGSVRFRGRARDKRTNLRVATGTLYRDPWKAHDAARRAMLVAIRDSTRRSIDRPHASRYPGVRRVKGQAWQARYWLTGPYCYLNLGVFTAAAFGSMEGAERAAGRCWAAFDADVRRGRTPRAVWRELKRSGVIPRGCRRSSLLGGHS